MVPLQQQVLPHRPLHRQGWCPRSGLLSCLARLQVWRRPLVGLPALLVAPALALLLAVALAPAAPAWAADGRDGARLFEAHCAGCHVNGGNIIRRGKTLRLAALERQGVASPEAIARIAAAGVGQMSGYGEQLGEAGVEAVAAWVWQQAQTDWPRG